MSASEHRASSPIPTRDEVRGVHERTRLALTGKDSLWEAPPELFAYFLALLHDRPADAPAAALDDWWRLLNLVYPHNLLPLLHYWTHKLPAALRPPAEVSSQLQRLYVESRFRVLMMETQLKEALAALAMSGAPALLLKGIALSHTVYPDPALRPATDIDLLVRQEQYPQAKLALLRLGYRDHEERFETIPLMSNESSFIHPLNSNYRVDLHWAMHPFNRVERMRVADDLIERAVKIQTPTFSFLAPSPVDELIQSAQHLTWNHNRSVRLIWVHDLMLLARRLTPEEWDRALALCSRYQTVLAVREALELVRVWTGFVPPPPFDQPSNWPRPSPKETEVWQRLFSSQTSLRSRFYLAWSDDWSPGQKLGFLLRIAFPRAALMRRNYPSFRPWLLPWSYVRRGFRLVDRLLK